MIDKLLLSPQTKSQVQLFIKQPAHALLITGAAGSGKYALAEAMAASLLGQPHAAGLKEHPYFLHLIHDEGKQDISIEGIRIITKALKLRTTGKEIIRRVVIIEDAQTMSTEAQNALLKALEEPPADTVFLLTSPSEKLLLPTIASRAQGLNVKPVSQAMAIDYYKGSYPEAAVTGARRLSGGAAGLLDALLKDEADHPLKLAVDEVKKLLGQTKYERLLTLDALAKDKTQLALVLEALNRVLAALYSAAVEQNKLPRAQNILSSRRLVNQLQKAIQANANPRLIGLTLGLNLKL